MSKERLTECEDFEECVTKNISTDFANGNPVTVTVTASYKRGTRATEDSLGGETIDKQRTVEAVYDINHGTAVLNGFYPNTTKTGERLYRRTLDVLCILPYTYRVVDEHTPDDVDVRGPERTVRELFQEYDAVGE